MLSDWSGRRAGRRRTLWWLKSAVAERLVNDGCGGGALVVAAMTGAVYVGLMCGIDIREMMVAKGQ